MNTINSDMDSHPKDNAWYQEESRTFQKLTSFQHKRTSNESQFAEKPTKKLVKQDNRVFERVSSEAIGLEIDELDFLNQIHQKNNTQVKLIDEPKSVITKNIKVSQFFEQKTQLKKIITTDFKSGQEFLQNINKIDIELTSSDDEKESKEKFQTNRDQRKSLDRKPERNYGFGDLSDIDKDPVFTKACEKVCSKLQEEVQNNACEKQNSVCKKVDSNFQEELQHKIKDMQLKKKIRHIKEEEFRAITRLMSKRLPSKNLNSQYQKEISSPN